MIFTAFHGLKRTGGHQAARTINRAHTPMISTLQKLTDPLHGHMQHAATHKWNFTWHTVSNALANIPSFMFINMWNFLCKMFSIKRTKWYHFIGNYLVLSNLYLTFNTLQTISVYQLYQTITQVEQGEGTRMLTPDHSGGVLMVNDMFRHQSFLQKSLNNWFTIITNTKPITQQKCLSYTFFVII